MVDRVAAQDEDGGVHGAEHQQEQEHGGVGQGAEVA